MDTPRQCDVDITLIHLKENIDQFPRYFDVLFRCNLDGQKIDFFKCNFDWSKTQVFST